MYTLKSILIFLILFLGSNVFAQIPEKGKTISTKWKVGEKRKVSSKSSMSLYSDNEQLLSMSTVNTSEIHILGASQQFYRIEYTIIDFGLKDVGINTKKENTDTSKASKAISIGIEMAEALLKSLNGSKFIVNLDRKTMKATKIENLDEFYKGLFENYIKTLENIFKKYEVPTDKTQEILGDIKAKIEAGVVLPEDKKNAFEQFALESVNQSFQIYTFPYKSNKSWSDSIITNELSMSQLGIENQELPAYMTLTHKSLSNGQDELTIKTSYSKKAILELLNKTRPELVKDVLEKDLSIVQTERYEYNPSNGWAVSTTESMNFTIGKKIRLVSKVISTYTVIK